MSAPEDIRETVRRRYAEAATRSAAGDHEQARAVETACCAVTPTTTDEGAREVETSCCSAAPVATTDEQGRVVFGAELYGPGAAEGAPVAALAASLGCGVPTAVADLRPGEVVLDLGSGAGADVLISARRVAPGGRGIGLDMTDEMLELARRNAAQAGVDNVEFVKGYLEDIPLPDASVDVVISNCVINLAADKNVVLAEAARVLRVGGRLAFSDVIADEGMDESTRVDMAEWTGCIAGALTQTEFTQALTTAGFTNIEIRPTHRVHTHAQAAIIRASLTERPESHPAPSLRRSLT
jgi:arsenite methyltransferase